MVHKSRLKRLQCELETALTIAATNNNGQHFSHSVELTAEVRFENEFTLSNEATGAELKAKWKRDELSITNPDGSHSSEAIIVEGEELLFAETTTQQLATRLVNATASS